MAKVNKNIDNELKVGILHDQYKMLEERRKVFVEQFMKTIGYTGTVLGAIIGLNTASPYLNIILH